MKCKNTKPSYEEILVKWEESKPWFMLWLSEVCGLDEFECAEVDKMICTDSDVAMWGNFFDGDFDNVRGTIDVYRKNYSATYKK